MTFEEHIKIYKALNKNRVKYLVIGGVASVLYGVPRLTLDIDILIEPTLKNAESLIRAFREAGYKQALRTEPEDIIRMGMYTFSGELFIDVFSGARDEDFQKMWTRREVMQVGKTKIKVISLEDLIETKRHLGREKDKEDILLLRKILDKEI